MLTRLQTLASLYRELGLRWSAFRLAYAFRLRSGLVRLQMPQYAWCDRPLAKWLKTDIPSEADAYTEWRKANAPKFFFDLLHVMLSDSEASLTTEVETLRYRSGNHGYVPWNPQTAIEEADRIFNGEIKFFSHENQQTGFPPNWHRDPVTGIELDSTKHWSHLSDDGEVDIKFVWEVNRFGMVYPLVRAYAATKNEKYAEAFWKLISDWAEHNPPNTGANWKDGQEIALRLMAWTFGFYAFINSPSAAPERVAQFTLSVAAQAERIYKNIDYSISTRSNHTISEAFGLWMVGLLFPELKDSEKYLKLGRELLEREASAQIFPDGSYSMYSLNYHRFVLHIYLYMIRLSELNQSPVSNLIYQAVSSSIHYLSCLIDPQTGQMPVYGSNDGALVLPLNNCDFADYRPLLQLGAFITNGERLFESGDWDEDLYWLCGESPLSPGERARRRTEPVEVVREIQDITNFPHGGIYILRNTNSKAIIRCTDYRARPSHADQLHVDLWWQGKNIACDAGTYLYSGEGIWRNGLARTSAHNTVIVDEEDQMTRVSRFTWADWARGKVLQHGEKIWQGEHDGYHPINHKRTVLMLENDRWLVVDSLDAKVPHHYTLHWLLNDFPYASSNSGVQELAPALSDSKLSDSRTITLSLDSMKCKMQVGLVQGTGNFSIVRADPNSTRGWRSRYYGHKESAISVMLETDQPQAVFWTFFGFEDDVVVLNGDVLQINSLEINLKTVDDRPSTVHRLSSTVS